MATEIDRLNFVMGIDQRGVAVGRKKILASFSQISARAKITAAAVVGIGAAFIIAATKAATAASKFEDAFNEVRTLVDETTIDTAALSEEVLRLSEQVGRPPEEVARGLYQVISAGVQDASEAMRVLEIATKASIGGLTDQFTAVDALTTVMNAYQISVEGAEEITDIMLNTVKEGKLTFGDLASNIGIVAPTAALAKVSFEELTAALAVMTKQGNSMEESTTAINQLLIQSIKISGDAAAAAENFGVEIGATALATDGLIGIMNNLNKATDADIEKLIKIIPNVRAFRGAAILAGTGIEEFNRILASNQNALGTTNEFYRKIKESTSELSKELNTKLNIAMIRFGQNVLPFVNRGLEALIGLIDSLTKTKLQQLADQLRDIEGADNLARAAIEADNLEKATTALIKNQEELNELTSSFVRLLEGRPTFFEDRKESLDSIFLLSKSLIEISKEQNGLEKISAAFAEVSRVQVEAKIRRASALIEKDQERIDIEDKIIRQTDAELFIIKKLLDALSKVAAADLAMQKSQQKLNQLKENEGKIQKENTEAAIAGNVRLSDEQKRLKKEEAALIEFINEIERIEAKMTFKEVAKSRMATIGLLENQRKIAIRVYGAESKLVKDLTTTITNLRKESLQETIDSITDNAAAEIKLIQINGKFEKQAASDIKALTDEIRIATSERFQEHLDMAIKTFGAESLIVKQLMILIGKLKAEVEEEIEVTLKTDLVLSGIDESSRVVAGLGRQFGRLNDVGELTIRRVGDIAGSLIDLRSALKNTESSFLDKFVPGLGLVATGISILSGSLSGQSEQTVATAITADILADKMQRLNSVMEAQIRLQNLTQQEELQRRLKQLGGFGDIFGIDISAGFLKAFAEGGDLIELLGGQIVSVQQQQIFNLLNGLGREAVAAFLNMQSLITSALEDGFISDEEAAAIDEAIAEFSKFTNALTRMNEEAFETLQQIDSLTSSIIKLAEAAREATIEEAGRQQVLRDLVESGLTAEFLAGLIGDPNAINDFIEQNQNLTADQILLLRRLLEILGDKDTAVDDAIKGKEEDRRRREFIEEIQDAIKIVDERGLRPGITPGDTTDVRRFVGITEVQGSVLIGVLNTSRIIQQEMLDIMKAGINIPTGGVEQVEEISTVLANDVIAQSRAGGFR